MSRCSRKVDWKKSIQVITKIYLLFLRRSAQKKTNFVFESHLFGSFLTEQDIHVGKPFYGLVFAFVESLFINYRSLYLNSNKDPFFGIFWKVHWKFNSIKFAASSINKGTNNIQWVVRSTDTQNYQIFRIDLTDQISLLANPLRGEKSCYHFLSAFFLMGIDISLHSSQKLSLVKTMNA